MDVQAWMNDVLERLDKNESVDNELYWMNMFFLLVVTWTAILYLFSPIVGTNAMPFSAVLVLLYLAAFNLIQYNQLEVLRRKVNDLQG